MYPPPHVRPLVPWLRLPDRFRKRRRSDWADFNLGGRALDCFLEGPCFDAHGNLYVVDVPFGRVFRIDAEGEWSLVSEYEGWPNGAKLAADGTLLIADHKRGLLRVDPGSGGHTLVFDQAGGAPLLGLNDLTFAPDGTLYVTDQGQTGLHDPRGRVLRVSADGAAEVVLECGPSPNGLVFDREWPWLYVAMTRANAIWRVPIMAGKATKVGIAIQLSGGIGPDGLALDQAGRLLVGHAPFGVWRFDRNGWPKDLFMPDDPAFITNIAVRTTAGSERLVAVDSIEGRILQASLA